MNAPHPHWRPVTTPAAHFIGNRWLPAADGATLPMIDPSDGAPFAAIARGVAADIDAAVAAARRAADGPWRALAPAQRGRLMYRIAMLIVEHTDELALIEAR